MSVRYPHLELALNIEGNGCWSAEGQRREISSESGSAQLVYFNDIRIRAEHRKNKRILHAELRMDARLWRPLFLELECSDGAVLFLLRRFDRSQASGSCATAAELPVRWLGQAAFSRDILLQTLAQPPSLLALSRKISLNDYKLKIGFKEVFEMTVFEFVRRQRLEKAWVLLENGSLNVSQAASLVGYNNFSHFAALFKKTYGVNPSNYARDVAKT
ncbi:helix-turn-helix transcriptional regulator [Paenibacillus elgii]|uniref:helix-turn-helix transcriptional regulator n=1 Tax=Paenibacillus elgii TaxID=189691 RepID=UPI001EF813F2|nr:helix-turn-helix transcriptional regulator [Paenibacillus elgii]